MNVSTNPYAGHRYPTEIISHAAWLYFGFTLSFRDVEELLAAHGIVMAYETVQQLCLKFGHQFAKEIGRRQPRLCNMWFLDEVFVTMGGQHHYLWQAVDQDGDVLDILVQKNCYKRAVKRFFRKLLLRIAYVATPRGCVTGGLGFSHGPLIN